MLIDEYRRMVRTVLSTRETRLLLVRHACRRSLGELGTRLLLATAVIVGCATSTEPDASQVPGLGVLSESGNALRPDVDTFLGTFAGGGGVVAEIERDTETRVEGDESLRTTVRTSGDGFAGWFVSWGDAGLVADQSYTRDLSAYASGSLRFWLKSSTPLEAGIRSGNVTAGRETSKVILGEAYGFAPDDEWWRVCIPLTTLAGPHPRADLTRVKVLFVIASNAASGGTDGQSATFWVDDVRWLMTPCG
jgi:hypothetical protein